MKSYLEQYLFLQHLSDDPFHKKAGKAEDMVSGLKNYIGNHVDSENKTETALNLIVPGALAALGFPWLSMLLKAAEYIFGVNIGAVFTHIQRALSSKLKSGEPVSNEEVNQITQSAVSQQIDSTDVTSEEAEKLQTQSIAQEAQQLKLALLTVEAKGLSLSRALSAKSQTSKGLSTVIGFVVKTILLSFGLMVGADAISSLLGGKSGFKEKVTPEAGNILPSGRSMKAVGKLTLNPAYTPEKLNTTTDWIVNTPLATMDQKIIQWAKEVYLELKGQDQAIRQSAGFQSVLQSLHTANEHSDSPQLTFIPSKYKSRKDIVDLFAEEVAESLPQR